MISTQLKNKIHDSMMQVLAYAAEKDYSGYSKFDAMNSPLLELALGWNSLLRLMALQTVNRVPLNLRKFFGVKKSRNPKGIANFIKALCNLYVLNPQAEVKKEIESLAHWLLDHRSGKNGENKGTCWGYNFAWQNPGFYAPKFFPNAIVTVFCAESFLTAYHTLQKREYLETAVSAARYLLEELPVLEEDGDKKCIGYVHAPLKLKVVNINAVAGGFLAKLSKATGEKKYLEEAIKLINWTVSVKTGYHAWHYTHPATAFVKNHDNYHTGGVLDGIHDYLTVSGDHTHLPTYLKGLKYYEEELFDSSGAPRWRNHKQYPYDIHGSAQGILSFTKAASFNPSYMDMAVRCALWAVEHMQSTEGGFYYQKHRWFTWKLDLMRWNNSWMAWALSEQMLYFLADQR